MKNRSNWILGIAFGIFCLSVGIMKARNTDKWGIGGEGIYNNQDMARIGAKYSFHLYNGSIQLGDNGLAPSTNNSDTNPSITSGGYYGIKVPFLNGSGSTVVNGSVIVSSTTLNSATTSDGSMVAITATTTIMGISDGTVLNGAVGTMTISGYAVVLTTGAVPIGSLLVSTAGSNGTGAAGYAGQATGTVVVGTVIGTALTVGTTNSTSVLALIHKS